MGNRENEIYRIKDVFKKNEIEIDFKQSKFLWLEYSSEVGAGWLSGLRANEMSDNEIFVSLINIYNTKYKIKLDETQKRKDLINKVKDQMSESFVMEIQPNNMIDSKTVSEIMNNSFDFLEKNIE